MTPVTPSTLRSRTATEDGKTERPPSYGEPEQFITILELPPVDSPESAVKVGVAYQIKKGKL